MPQDPYFEKYRPLPRNAQSPAGEDPMKILGRSLKSREDLIVQEVRENLQLRIIPYSQSIQIDAGEEEEVVPPNVMMSVTTTGGTDAGPDGTNEVTLTAEETAVLVWIGPRPINEVYLEINIEIDGEDAQRIRAHRYQRLVIPAPAGSTVSFNTRSRLEGTGTMTDTDETLTVKPCVDNTFFPEPTGLTGTANCDKSGPPVWTPVTSHITLTDNNSAFVINSTASDRDFFISEQDEEGSFTPEWHLFVPANVSKTVQCHFKNIALANYSGATASITADTGSTIGGTSNEFRHEFTAEVVINVPSGDEAAFKAAMNDSRDNVDVVVAAGTLDLSGSGLPMNSTNYATAVTLNRRIRSATGVNTDVTITGTAFSHTVAVGKAWIWEAMTIDITSVAGIHIIGANHGWKMKISGAPTGTTNPTLGLEGNSTYGALDVYWVFCDLRDATEDTVDLNQTSGATRSFVGHMIACTLNGNGNGTAGNGQVLTSHNGSQLIAWGCNITDVSNTSRQTFIVPDGTSYVYLLFCYSAASDITFATGMEIRAAGVFWCRFGAVQRFVLSVTTITTQYGWVIGGQYTQKVTSGIAFFYSDLVAVNIIPYVAGVTIITDTESGCDCFHWRTGGEIDGVDVTMGATTTSSRGLRIQDGSPNAGSRVVVRNSRFRCATSGARPIELGTSDNISLDLVNNIFENSMGTYSYGASGTLDNTAENNFFGVNAFPTNFATRFTGEGTISSNVDGALNYWSASTSPGLGSDGTPTSGLSDAEGKTVGFFGGMDRYGRPLRLGGSFVRGPVELQTLKTDRILSPGAW